MRRPMTIRQHGEAAKTEEVEITYLDLTKTILIVRDNGEELMVHMPETFFAGIHYKRGSRRPEEE